MGNKILTQYDVQKEPCYYSTDLKWRLHSASFKERPDDKLTIFIFEKKVVEKYPKNTKEQLLEVLRRDASCLQRLRHPQILSVVEALSEERSTLAFATKPVIGTVAQLLENNRFELSSLEMKCGLLDAAEALQFLHQDAKTAHLGFSPNSIFLDPTGKWLLGGLGFSQSQVQWGQLVDCPFAFAGDSQPGQLSAEPPSRYAAPEMCSMPGKCGLESDIFSLGLLVYELMSAERQPLLRSAPRGYTAGLMRPGSVPAELEPALRKCLSANPSERMTIAAFLNSDFFMDVNVRAIRFLEQLKEKDEAQRVTFLKGLPKLLQDPQSPLCGHRVLRERVLPHLCAALLFPSLYGVVVPCIISLLKRDRVADSAHFQAKLWPSLKPLFTAKEIPIEVVILFLKELDLLVSLAAPPETQAALLPFVLRCLELQEPVILNEVLEKVPYLHKKFEYRQVKDQILPRMLQLLLGSSVVKVKVQVLMGLNKIFEIFDKNTITDVILVAFEKMTKTERSPAVCMCLLGCYDAMSKALGHKVTSERVLPLIMPLLVEESLSAEQWETQLSVCKKLLQRVESARRKEFDTRKDAISEAGEALGVQNQGKAHSPSPPPASDEPQTFESLLFAGTSKATRPAAQPAPAAAAAVKVPPPSTTPSQSNDLLSAFGGGGGGSSAPKSSQLPDNFDPFAGPSGPSVATTAKPSNFDPFAQAGGLGNLNFSSAPAAPAAAYPGQPLSLPAPVGSAPPASAPGGLGMRGLAYDPFAEIDGGKGY